MGGAAQVFAATPTSAPGGQVANPVVRQVDIARPAVVRIITRLGGHLTVQFAPTTQSATFPLSGGSYPLELSGSGAFISAHGDILTADHVVNPPHDQSINDALYQTAASDIADYINAHFRVSQPATSDGVLADLEAGVFPSTPTYDQPSSEVYLSTAYAGSIDATRFSNIPAKDHASVDRIEAQSSFDAMDVAIIHVNGMDDMPSIQLDDSSQVAEQDTLTVIGFPGLADVSSSPTNLMTSSINKVYVSAMKTTDANAPLIQVGGNIEHGDSGGPALDDSGHIVGIVSFGLLDPNGTGQTSFLQASNSARTLMQSLNLNTAPGLFEQAWAQAFNDYASPAPGHWHKAFRELQDLVNGHPAFLGATPYLTYAQDRATTEQLPTSPSIGGPNPVLIIILVLLGVLIVCAIVYFVVRTRRHRPVPAMPAPVWGAYAQQQSGIPGVYAAPTISHSSNGYPAVSGESANAYPSALGTLSDTHPSVPGETAGIDAPVPGSPGAEAWYAQTTSEIPQTPQPDVTPAPVAAIIPIRTSTPPPLTLFPDQDAVASQAARPAMPGWAPLPHTPQPVASPTEQPASMSTPLEEGAAQSVAQTEAAPFAPMDIPAQEMQQGPDDSILETPQQMDIPPLETPQSAADISTQETQHISPLEISQSTTDVSAQETQQSDLAPAFVPEIPQGGARTLFAQPTATPRSFSVPKRPVAPGYEVSTSSGVHTWMAPCGHTNTPEVRFCRVCGQPVRASVLETNE